MSTHPLPNPKPPPEEELTELMQVWRPAAGWRIFSAVNNTYIGLFYIGAALLFLLLGGILALLMRTQLAVPESDLIGHDTYNQLFTMHGSVMMFLFAVPMVEAVAILLLPAMLSARDLPFPRLSAYAFWAYFLGGLAFFLTIFFDVAPDGGWFMYPPLTGREFSPGVRTDFWLLGIGFIEVSAIAGAIEIIVGVLRTRPPGMTLSRMPIYAWAMLVTAAMIVFAFPSVIVATALLELERSLHWPFFVVGRGGDPVLWQHLFWLFGHPDVYIIFLPAAGLVSMIVPTLAQKPLLAYRWIVLALLATGLVSFALWAHHMFAIGMPHVSAGFFSAASMLVAVPASIQVFAWVGTLQSGRVQRTTPLWFILGFFGIFVPGGLTGVMLAAVSYDWQVHDTYFVVAHLHYVLIGGMVFPVFAAIYYWAPMVSGRQLSERMGKWACGLMFIGMNLAFFPMHISGLLGMPRRVWTYSADLGWDPWNLLSTLGAYLLATGVLLVVIDLILHLRIVGKVNFNPWRAGTLEWLPQDSYAVRSIPEVSSREPLWDNPELPQEVERGHHYLPGVLTGGRETIVTDPVDARPQYLLRLPGESWLPLLAAIGTAVFFLALTVTLTPLAGAGAALALVCIFRWLWETDPAPGKQKYEIGGGLALDDHATGSSSHAWWAMVVLMLVNGTIFANLVFAFYYLWTVTPAGWPPADLPMPRGEPSILSVVALAVSAIALFGAHRTLRANRPAAPLMLIVLGAAAALWAALFGHFESLRQAGIEPRTHAYGAIHYTLLAWQAVHVLTVTLMAGYLLARRIKGLVDATRRGVFDNMLLLWIYTLAQGLLALIIAHSPRLT